MKTSTGDCGVSFPDIKSSPYRLSVGPGPRTATCFAARKRFFDILVTMDGSIARQQNIAQCEVAVVALQARSNRLADTLPLMPKLLSFFRLSVPVHSPC